MSRRRGRAAGERGAGGAAGPQARPAPRPPGGGSCGRRAIAARHGLYDPPVGPLRNATLVGTCALAVLVAGCTKEPDPVPIACFAEPTALVAALRPAPAPVVLSDGTRLSRCVAAARTNGDLQSLGISLGRAADRLRPRARTDPVAAVQLGYLGGAVRAGAKHAADGIADQLARRVGQLATPARGASAAALAALARGDAAGERTG